MKRLQLFLSHWQNWLGLLLVLGFFFVSLGAPVLSPMDPSKPGPFQRVGRFSDRIPHPPGANAVLGTLPGQIDVYHALIWGTREAIQFGLVAALGAFFFGVVFGAIAGYAGGTAGSLMMRVADAFLAFPMIAGVALIQQLVAVTIEAMGGVYWFNSESFGRVIYFEFTPPFWVSFLMKVDPILICLILFLWMPYARLVYTMVINLKQSEFIQAARALGAGPWRVIQRHLIPNSIGPAIVMAARDVGSAVILQATFAFIGLGGNSPWGIMLSMGRNWIIGPGGDLLAYWWLFLPATLVVILFGVTWNLLGDGLNEALEPKALSNAFARAGSSSMPAKAYG
jgi:peptide/nickel transport system permease protein